MKNTKLWVIIGSLAALLIVVVVSLAVWGISAYNSLTTLDVNVENAWSNVETQYQRRMDLIPNLVNTVKGYSAHESQTLEKVTNARAGLTTALDNARSASGQGPDDVEQFQKSQASLNKALGLYINAVHEAYPDLKANTNFLDLQTQLEGTENRISTARRDYNEMVKDYNTRVRRFPTNLIAPMMGFETRKPFEADAGADNAPTVQF